MKTQQNKNDERFAKAAIIAWLILAMLLFCGIRGCAQSLVPYVPFKTSSKQTVQYDTIPVINQNVISVYLLEKKNYMIYKYNGCQEAIPVSKSIVDYMILCCDLKCSCNLAILRRKKDGVFSRVIKCNINKYQNSYLNFKLYDRR